LAVLARGEFPSGTDLKVRTDFQTYQEQEKTKRDLKDKIAKLGARKNELEARMSGAVVPEKDLEAQIKALQGQNGLYETQLENLRENIAVLDYKINTLERYRNRNKAN
jgi:phage shock protein A